MILVDTPVWVDHLRAGDAVMASLLENDRVLIHPFVKGEIALGNLRSRKALFEQLNALPSAVLADNDEVAALIERERLFGAGIGYVDTHLLASVRLTPGASLWTRDKRLADVAARLALAATIVH